MLEYCPGAHPRSRGWPASRRSTRREGRHWLSTEFAAGHPSGWRGGAGADSAPCERPSPNRYVFEPRRWRQWVFGPAMLSVHRVYVVFAVGRWLRAARSDPYASLSKQLLFGLVLLVVVLIAATMSLFRGRLSTYALTVNATTLSAQAGFWRQRPSNILRGRHGQGGQCPAQLGGPAARVAVAVLEARSAGDVLPALLRSRGDARASPPAGPAALDGCRDRRPQARESARSDGPTMTRGAAPAGRRPSPLPA